MIGGGDRKRIGHLDGRFEPAAVELVVRRKRVEARMIGIDAVLGERRAQNLAQHAAAVVAGNVALRAHLNRLGAAASIATGTGGPCSSRGNSRAGSPPA